MNLQRRSGLLVTKVGEETLVYNQATDQAHCLNAAAARVFAMCDGSRDFQGLCRELNSEALALEAGELLIRQGLISGDLPAEQTDRRALLKKALILAATVPLVWSVVAPAPSAASSRLAPP